VADDLTPAAINWPDFGVVGIIQSNNSAQVTGINDVLGLRLTWTPTRAVFLVKTSAVALASNDIVNNPSGWVPMSNGNVVFAANNTHIGFATNEKGATGTVRNADTGNQIIDTFTVLDLG
jgi:hypothetical protein